MTPLQIELVLDPADAVQQELVRQLQQGLNPGDQLYCTSLAQWRPQPGRTPGSDDPAPIVVLLCPATWQQHHGAGSTLPAGVLLLVERVQGVTNEINAALGWQALWHREPTVRCAVLTPADGAGTFDCLMQVGIPQLSRWRHQQERFLRASADYLLWWIRLCESRQSLHPLSAVASVPWPSAKRLRRRQRWMLQTRWAVERATARMLRPEPNADCGWQVGVARLDPHSNGLQLLHRLPGQGADWFADPFLISDGPRTWLFCERWDSVAGKGVIDLFALQDSGLQRLGSVIEESFHLSFPRVVRSQGTWYATVESSANGDVRLYRALTFPTVWTLERVLLNEQAFADPLLIPSAQGWWLLVNSQSTKAWPRETAPELHLFHSHDLRNGTFTAHPGSPLLVDSACGRNGGLLTIAGQLHRVAQCVGIDNAYGQDVELRRIDQLSVGGYGETAVSTDWLTTLPRRLGASHLHTLNNGGGWLAFDFRSSQDQSRRGWQT